MPNAFGATATTGGDTVRNLLWVIFDRQSGIASGPFPPGPESGRSPLRCLWV